MKQSRDTKWNGDGGDQYTGFDRLGRVINQYSLNTSNGTAVDRSLGAARLDSEQCTCDPEFVGFTDVKGLCERYNKAVSRTLGHALLFIHDDVEFHEAGLATRLSAHMEAL